MNSLTVEKKVEDFLKNVFKSETIFNKKNLQRKKFLLLSKLVADLFKSKNSQVCFKNISSLIILILNIYNEKFPVDLYSDLEDESLKKFNAKFNNILKDEFL